jgi:dipeptidyl aminopeptidase/acylaminoacyl peptidase
MKNILIFGLGLGLIGCLGYIAIGKCKSPNSIKERMVEIPRPLDKYSIDNLSEAEVMPEKIKIGESLKTEENFDSHLFSFEYDPTLQNRNEGERKVVSGLINLPNKPGVFPLVIMIRGYVDQGIFETGMGSKNAGEAFAGEGFITLAPDFLGYGGSDSEAENIFETRFQTYTTVLSLLKSLESIEKWDKQNVFIWAHSNGGQIALTVLAVTREAIPTTLWAPVTKPFPYNVLYYTDESDDGGKLIRRELARFEDLYDTDLYSFSNYLDRISAPIQIHQGTADDAVPVEWSDNFVSKMKESGKEISYYKHPGADHNMVPAWDEALESDINYFRGQIGK